MFSLRPSSFADALHWLLVRTIALCLFVSASDASYAFYVGKNLTEDGSVLVGGTGEEVSSHWLQIFPARDHPANATIQVTHASISLRAHCSASRQATNSSVRRVGRRHRGCCDPRRTHQHPTSQPHFSISVNGILGLRRLPGTTDQWWLE